MGALFRLEKARSQAEGESGTSAAADEREIVLACPVVMAPETGLSHPRDGSGRPLLAYPLRGILSAIVRARKDELGHIDVGRVVLVAGAARRSTRASIRPLTFGGSPPRWRKDGCRKPEIYFRQRLMLYELCLRPLFSLRASAQDRLQILAHELWHIHPSFDGRLDPSRRHPLANPAAADRWARDAATDVATSFDTSLLDYDGEIRAPMWLERPPTLVPDDLEARLRYDESDLFLGVVRQRGAPR